MVLMSLWSPVGNVRPHTLTTVHSVLSSRSFDEMTKTCMLIIWCTDMTGSLSPTLPTQLMSRSQTESPGEFYCRWSLSAGLIKCRISPKAHYHGVRRKHRALTAWFHWLITWLIGWLIGWRIENTVPIINSNTFIMYISTVKTWSFIT